MIARNYIFIFAMLGICLVAGIDPASAQAPTRVGEAAVVKNEVLRVAASSTSQINVGDGLLRDEVVRTGLDSATRLVMADSTNLSLGPNATLKLDRTVFDDEHHYRDVAVRLTSGTFRFVTGNSEKAAYKITTPLATIGVRGTELDIRSLRYETIVNLLGGAASVCTVTFECIQLTQPGDTAIITLSGGNPRWFLPSMTAAIPPACCAGADDGKSLTRLDRLRHHARHGGNACCCSVAGC